MSFALQELKSLEELFKLDLSIRKALVDGRLFLRHDSGDGWKESTAHVNSTAFLDRNARASDNARVYDNASVYDNAIIHGNACVYGNARVFEDARVDEDASVYEDARVLGKSRVYGKARIHGNAIVNNCHIRDVELTDGIWVGMMDKDSRLRTLVMPNNMALIGYLKKI